MAAGGSGAASLVASATPRGRAHHPDSKLRVQLGSLAHFGAGQGGPERQGL